VRTSGKPLNVLFIVGDDLRPEMGCYGIEDAHTPNIDRLARRGLVFERAYCQHASCAPSRSSLMTGLRPDTTRIFDNEVHIRQALPNAITLPQLFKQHGYYTRMVGKVFHNYGSGHDHEWWADPASWSVPDWCPDEWEYFTPEGGQSHQAGKGPVIQAPDLSDDRLYDGEVAHKAIQALNEVRNRPFFLAVGFKRPHLPWVAPKRYFDYYAYRTIGICRDRRPPLDAPAQQFASTLELRGYAGVPRSGEISDEMTRRFRAAYMACISFVDAQIGRVLAEVERLGLDRTTIVVLWGDSGFSLGEQGQWGKGDNYVASLRVPLVISFPSARLGRGRTMAPVELVDVYPTLCELCSLPAPPSLEGTSLGTFFTKVHPAWNKAAFSQGPAPWVSNPKGLLHGRTIRTDRYRLIELVPFAERDNPLPGRALYELYEYDVDLTEKVNVANRSEYAGVRTELIARLHAGWSNAAARGGLC
jgi:iduronate 2-sulfatase